MPQPMPGGRTSLRSDVSTRLRRACVLHLVDHVLSSIRSSTRVVPRAASAQFASRISSRVLSSGSVANERSGSAGLLMSATMNADLRKRELLRGLAEIGAAGRFDAVLPAAEIRHVDVFQQQLVAARTRARSEAP